MLGSSIRGREGRFLRPSRLVPLCVAAVLFGGGFADGGSANPKLLAYAQSCQIQRADGSTQQLLAGRYVVVVRDTSRTRYFSLVGPGVSKSTTARYVGRVSWTLSLKKGTYRFRCGAARSLRGTLTVN